MKPGELEQLRVLSKELRDVQVRLNDARAHETFSRRTQQNRKMLVLFSAIGLAMAFLGVIPTEIQALGIRFSPPEQAGLLAASALLILYFLVMFLGMAWVEMDAWNVRTRLAMELVADSAQRLASFRSLTESDTPVSVGEVAPAEIDRAMVDEAWRVHRQIRMEESPRAPVHRFVLALDFLLPVVLAVVAILAVLVQIDL